MRSVLVAGALVLPYACSCRPVEPRSDAAAAISADGAATDVLQASQPLDAAARPDQATAPDVAPADSAADLWTGDPWFADPTRPCARVPSALVREPYPEDVLYRVARLSTLVLARVTALGTHPFVSPRPSGDLQVEDSLPAWPAGTTPRITVAAAIDFPAVGFRGYFNVTKDGSDSSQRLYVEHVPVWRFDAARYPDLFETVTAVRGYLATRPVFKDLIVDAAAIVDAEVTAVRPGRPWHCSSNDYTAVLRINQALCGNPGKEITIYVNPNGVCDPDPAGPQPKLMPGQRALFLLRRTDDYAWRLWSAGGPVFAVLHKSTDLRPLDRWAELAALRVSADR